MLNKVNIIKEKPEQASKISQLQQVVSFEIKVVFNQGYVINVQNLMFEKAEFNGAQHLSITIYHQGGIDHARTSDFSISSLLLMIKNAKTYY